MQNPLKMWRSSNIWEFHYKQNSMHEGIKARLKPGNACCQLFWNHLPSHLILKNIRIRTHRIMLHCCITTMNAVRILNNYQQTQVSMKKALRGCNL